LSKPIFASGHAGWLVVQFGARSREVEKSE